MKIVMKHFLSLCTLLSAVGCDAYLDVDPPRNQLVTANVFADEDLADGAVAGIYQEIAMGQSTHFASGGSNSVTALMDVATGTLIYNLNDAEVIEFADRQWLTTNSRVYTLWASAYKSIFRANEVLEGLAKNQLTNRALVSQLRGEALFIRAFCHLQLLQLFGGIPMAVTSDYRVTQHLPRSEPETVYDQVEMDLQAAADLLPMGYSHAMGERVRPNRYAAQLLLARVYLYQGKWKEAADASTDVIAQVATYQLSSDADELFLKSSREAIWQLKTVQTNGTNSYEGSEAIPIEMMQQPPRYSLSEDLLAALSGDQRGEKWIGNHMLPSGEAFTYPLKFKIRSAVSGSEPTEYSMVLRLAEAYLIRSEVRLELTDMEGALADLNALRLTHGGLEPIAEINAEVIRRAIEHERQVEFFYEWGHRWADLKRWGHNDILLPIPQREIEANPFLKQNPNY